MLRALQRSYHDDFVAPIKALDKKLFRVAPIAKSAMAYRYIQMQYELWGVESIGLPRKDDRMHVLLTGGVHGDEPAGGLAVMRFLQNEAAAWKKWFRFSAIPCVNPSGYEIVDRHTLDGTDLNRMFSEDTASDEASVIREWLSLQRHARNFDIAIDAHECFPGVNVANDDPLEFPLGYFLWEVCDSRKRRIGNHIIDAVREIVPICLWPDILGETAARGVISYPEGAGDLYSDATTLDTYLVSSGLTEHAFTLESPGIYHLQTRIAAHVAAINAALTALRDA